MTENESARMIECLHSIDATLKELLSLSKTKRAATPQMPVARQPLETAATEDDLDSKFGDEPVRFDPKNWTGVSYKGQKMSECPVSFLDQLASAFDYFAQKKRHEGEEQKAQYEERSARRARGWAARLRAGWTPKLPEGMTTKDDVSW